MSTQIENIKNPLLREFAEKAQHMSKGDFGMTIYGGVDLEAYAELIVRECIQQLRYKSAQLVDVDYFPEYKEQLEKHFGIKE